MKARITTQTMEPDRVTTLLYHGAMSLNDLDAMVGCVDAAYRVCFVGYHHYANIGKTLVSFYGAKRLVPGRGCWPVADLGAVMTDCEIFEMHPDMRLDRLSR